MGLLFASCGAKVISTLSQGTIAEYCTDTVPTSPIAGTTGSGLGFEVDPRVSSGGNALQPSSSQLSTYTTALPLQNLSGHGLLKGSHVTVYNEYCGESYGAFDANNQFNYDVSDGRFPEVMAYYHADAQRTVHDLAGTLLPASTVYLIANCPQEDNAYYSKTYDSQGNLIDFVCLGVSSIYPSGNFAHDGEVTVHEMQHANTGHAYSATVDLNQMLYDEAGALNEGISDFYAMMLAEPKVASPFDPQEFSRWALGLLFTRSSLRGAHRCPVYDADYPNCGSYASGASGFSSSGNHVSFAYPDGLGWPYAKNVSGLALVKSTWSSSSGQEEIHQNAPIVAGALYEMYLALKANHGDALSAQKLMSKLVVNALQNAPKPNSASDLSPVTMPVLGAKLVAAAASLGFSSADQTSIQAAADDRGLTNTPQVGANWASVGPGASATPGYRFYESSGSVNVNGKLNRGDRGELYLDISNSSANTAGGVLVDATVSCGSGTLRFMDANYNYGYISPTHAMIRYSKVNGSAIVSALSSGSSTYDIPTGTSYFKTDPNYLVAGYTALYVQIPSGATTGNCNLSATLTPANGPAVTLTYPLTIEP